MTRAFRIGRILGINIEIDYTWFIAFLLFAAMISTSLRMWGLPAMALPLKWLVAVITTLLFFGSVLVHELSHSLVALREGMKITGITLFVFGGVSKMSDEPKSAGDEFRMAVAGPLASMGLAIIFLLLAFVTRNIPGGETITVVSKWLGFMNGVLAVFNLLPGFPLDGGRVLRAGLWQGFANLAKATQIASSFGQGMGLLMIVWGIVSFFFYRMSGGLWMAFIGWFLLQAAQSSYQQLILKQSLSGVPVANVMTREVQWVPADLTLDRVVHDFVMTHNHPAFPVFTDGKLLGLLCLNNIRSVPRDNWSRTLAGEVTPPLSPEVTISPQADAWEALMRMASEDCGRLLVVEDGALKGIVSRTDIMRLIRRRMELGI